MSVPIEHTRHSFAHLLAAAIKRLYSDVKFGIGPVIESGFYYDFKDVKIGEEDLPKIEKEMRKIAAQGHEFIQEEWETDRALEYFEKEEQPYKLELINELVAGNPLLTKEGQGVVEKVGMVHMGDAFLDLCKGGHVENAKDLPLDAFKLTRVAGAYWRGDEKKPMLTRVYGVAFETKKELEEYRKQQEEAKKRDHKKLGKELGLFTFSDLVGPGLPLFAPKGATIRNILRNFVEDLERKYGYREVWIPHLAKPELYKISGHLEKFKEDLFYVKGKEDQFILKPMNCPHHTQIYKSQMRSYKDLPVRYFETTTVYRDEQPGELGGLVRVRSITQDDGHCFLREDQITQEFEINLKIQQELAKAVDLKDYWIRLSLRDEKNKKAYLGDDETWQKAQQAMEDLLKKQRIKYESKEGEAAFYGPKMDFMARDSLGREWQFSTIQLDFNLPKRFELEYTAEDGSKKMPVMIHRAFMGSIERFLAMLIEHYAGAFPLWLAPEQIWIVPVSEKCNQYAASIEVKLLQAYRSLTSIETSASPCAPLRIAVKTTNDTLGKKIREGQLQKIPYLIIVGEQEEKSQKISVRHRQKGSLGLSTVREFAENVKMELQNKIANS